MAMYITGDSMQGEVQKEAPKIKVGSPTSISKCPVCGRPTSSPGHSIVAGSTGVNTVLCSQHNAPKD